MRPSAGCFQLICRKSRIAMRSWTIAGASRAAASRRSSSAITAESASMALRQSWSLSPKWWCRVGCETPAACAMPAMVTRSKPRRENWSSATSRMRAAVRSPLPSGMIEDAIDTGIDFPIEFSD